MDSPEKDDDKNPTTFARFRGYFRRGCQVVFCLGFGYALAIAIGLIPVNRDFVPPSTGGVPIYVYSGAVHSDLILPTQTGDLDWRKEFAPSLFQKPVDNFSHVAIGWGDRGFYLDTPTWADLKASTAARALLVSSESVVHVQFMGKPRESKTCRRLLLSQLQYEELTDFIRDSFSKTDSKITAIDGESYGNTDAFFEGAGSYHAFNTCNCWAANALQSAGVTVPWFAPMPRTILWYLPPAEKQNEPKRSIPSG